MAIEGFTTANYLRVASGLGFAGTDPLFLSGWMFEPTAETAGMLVDLGDTGTNNRRGLTARTGGNPAAQINGAGLQAIATADEPNNTWFHLSGWYDAGTDVEVWLDGANMGSNAGSEGLTDPNVFTVGTNTPLAADAGAAMGIGEVSAWDPTGFDSTDRANLAAELATLVMGSAPNPIAVSNQGGQAWTGRLVAYWRLEDTTDLEDLRGSADLTITGSLTDFSGHPPVDAVPVGRGALFGGLRNTLVIT